MLFTFLSYLVGQPCRLQLCSHPSSQLWQLGRIHFSKTHPFGPRGNGQCRHERAPLPPRQGAGPGPSAAPASPSRPAQVTAPTLRDKGTPTVCPWRSDAGREEPFSSVSSSSLTGPSCGDWRMDGVENLPPPPLFPRWRGRMGRPRRRFGRTLHPRLLC